MEREISPRLGIVIILIAIVIAVGGVFVYERVNNQNLQQVASQNTSNAVADSCIETAMTQTDMNICSAQEQKKSDEQLSALYIKIRSQLEGKSLNQFLSAQEAWVTYRDENCKIPTILFDGGSGAPSAENMCLKELTDNRIKDIKNLYQGFVSGVQVSDSQSATSDAFYITKRVPQGAESDFTYNGEVIHGPLNRVTIFFNNDVDVSTLTTNNFYALDGIGGPPGIPAKIVYDKNSKSASLVFDNPINIKDYNGASEVTISIIVEGVKDANGNTVKDMGYNIEIN